MVFYLPGFLNQNRDFDGTMFNSLFFNLYYLETVIPQILLLLYLVKRKKEVIFSLYGITSLSIRDIKRGIIYFLAVTAMALGIGIIFLFISNLTGYEISTLPEWEIDTRMLPVIFFTCIATGYSEELFFRSYLLTEFISGKEDRIPVLIITSLLFASGHLYQGTGGFISTFGIGIFFSLVFLKERRVHSIAIAHSLYNFSVLFISILMS